MSGVDIQISATDNASDTLNQVASSTQALGDSAGDATSSTMGLGSAMQQGGRIGSSAMITLDRISISEDALTNAQARQSMAQENLTLAVQKYGAGSEQAVMAQDKLGISTRGVEIAQERLDVRMIYGVAVVLPGMIKGLQNLQKELATTTDANGVATISWDNLTAAQLANIAVTTLGIGLPIALMALNMAQMASNSSTTNSSTTNNYGNNYISSPSGSTAAFGNNFASAGRG
jgi:hypothetical protein